MPRSRVFRGYDAAMLYGDTLSFYAIFAAIIAFTPRYACRYLRGFAAALILLLIFADISPLISAIVD